MEVTLALAIQTFLTHVAMPAFEHHLEKSPHRFGGRGVAHEKSQGLPHHDGLRFSRYARDPSRASSASRVREWVSSAMAKSSASERAASRPSNALVSATAPGPPSQMLRAIFWAATSS